MKKLYLIRHAKSSWEHPEQEDSLRPLNEQGQIDAHEMSQWLTEQDPKIDLILSSPAVRAFETARIFAKTLEYPENKIQQNELIYDANVDDLISVIDDVPDRYKNILLFGHVPSLNLLANFLCDDHLVNIPTCGIYCVEINSNHWKDFSESETKAAFFKYPKHHDEKPPVIQPSE